MRCHGFASAWSGALPKLWLSGQVWIMTGKQRASLHTFLMRVFNRKQQLFLTSPGSHYLTAGLLTNLHTCMYLIMLCAMHGVMCFAGMALSHLHILASSHHALKTILFNACFIRLMFVRY